MLWLLPIYYLQVKLQLTIKNAFVVSFRFSRVSWNKNTPAKWFHSLMSEQQEHLLKCFKNISHISEINHSHNKTNLTEKHQTKMGRERGSWAGTQGDAGGKYFSARFTCWGSSNLWMTVIPPRFSDSKHKCSWSGISDLPCSSQLPSLLKPGSSCWLCSRLPLPLLLSGSQLWSPLLAAGSGPSRARRGHLPPTQHCRPCLQRWPPDTSKSNYDHMRVSIPLS